ncbi:uncharacterized protein B0T15DRAFT_531115 [Chaetomium strumarium]|uniref:2EXR domain-containing protein n=1 Tax=Chaetomium strumarium TaxID=1170767 RepID=A0AAJ0M119_9PEZI|nr:hypothetical protein B0T15DRAFT_531115 [Chaetomium strumarium]
MTGNAVAGSSCSFSLFPILPAELRLQIWESALAMQEPRVLNIFVKCHDPKRFFSPPSRLTMLNNEYLRRTDMVSTLLGVNSESRYAALAYLAAHPADEARKALLWRSKKAQRWKGLYKLGVDLLHLRIDPKRDALFLNGLDLEPILHQDGAPTGQFRRIPPDAANPILVLLPRRLSEQEQGGTLYPDGARRNIRELEGPERTFTSRFRTVIMPVHGLIDPWGREGVLENPMLPPFDRLAGYHTMLREMALKTFIAVVGHYRGRNLQLADLDFIPESEVARIVKEHEAGSTSGGGDGGGGRGGAVRSILHRDVLVMTAVFREWMRCGRIVHDCAARRCPQIDYGPFRRPALRFARVKEEVLARLSPQDQYFGNDGSTTMWTKETRRGGTMPADEVSVNAIEEMQQLLLPSYD